MPPFSRHDGISRVNNNETEKYAKEWERIFGKKKKRKKKNDIAVEEGTGQKVLDIHTKKVRR